MKTSRFKKKFLHYLCSVACLGVLTAGIPIQEVEAQGAFDQLRQRWAYGGTYQWWCEEGWYSKPAIADLNGDGKLEILAAAYSIVNVDADSGKLNWRVGSGFDRSNTVDESYVGRTWADLIVEDIDGDGQKEIVSGHGGGVLSVYDNKGYFKPGWPQTPVAKEIKSLKLADLDQNGSKSILVGVSADSGVNTYVFNAQGKLRKGWPQLEPEFDGTINTRKTYTGFAWGIFNNNLSTGDINGDGYPEIIVPSDVPFICAYDRNGELLPANPRYGGRTWGQVGFWQDVEKENRVENEGWGNPVKYSDPWQEKNIFGFAHNASVVDDVNNDGINEVIVTGYIADTVVGSAESLSTGLLILNGDRTRFKRGEYNWEEIPFTDPPLSEDYYLIESVMPNPVVTDLDGDGLKEILFSSFDGKVNCFWLDKEQKHSWPFDVQNGDGFEFSSTPEVIDLDGDGFKEVIFATWTEKEAARDGRLVILNYKGELLKEAELPKAKGTELSNGALAAPLVYDLDNNGSYEIILNTVYSGLVVYDTNVRYKAAAQ